MSELPVVVVGAGPVGLAAAAELVERGLEPLVLEKAGRGRRRGRAVASRAVVLAVVGAGRTRLPTGCWRRRVEAPR